MKSEDQFNKWINELKFSKKNFNWKGFLGLLLAILFIWYVVDTGGI